MGSKTCTNLIIEALNGAKDSLQSLTDLWQSHDATWESSPKIYQQGAKAATGQESRGHPGLCVEENTANLPGQSSWDF